MRIMWVMLSSTRRLIRTGRSLAVVLPKPFLRALRMRRGDELTVALVGRALVISKHAIPDPRVSLFPDGGADVGEKE